MVSEDTERVIAQRHLRTLSGLGAALGGARTEPEVIAAAMRALDDDPRSLPFSLVYSLDAEGKTATRTGSSGVPAGSLVAVPVVGAGNGSEWPVAELAQGTAVQLEGLRQKFRELPCGAWEHPPAQAYVVPLRYPRRLIRLD